MAQRRNNGNRKFTIFAIQLLPKIKTVADPTKSFACRNGSRESHPWQPIVVNVMDTPKP